MQEIWFPQTYANAETARILLIIITQRPLNTSMMLKLVAMKMIKKTSDRVSSCNIRASVIFSFCFFSCMLVRNEYFETSKIKVRIYTHVIQTPII